MEITPDAGRIFRDAGEPPRALELISLEIMEPIQNGAGATRDGGKASRDLELDIQVINTKNRRNDADAASLPVAQKVVQGVRTASTPEAGRHLRTQEQSGGSLGYSERYYREATDGL